MNMSHNFVIQCCLLFIGQTPIWLTWEVCICVCLGWGGAIKGGGVGGGGGGGFGGGGGGCLV